MYLFTLVTSNFLKFLRLFKNFVIFSSARRGQLLVFDDVTIYDQIVTWNEAKDLCEGQGQNMLTLESEEKFTVLNNRLSLSGFDL